MTPRKADVQAPGAIGGWDDGSSGGLVEREPNREPGRTGALEVSETARVRLRR